MTAAVWTLIAMQGATIIALFTALFQIRRELAKLSTEIIRLNGRFDVLEARLDEHLAGHP